MRPAGIDRLEPPAEAVDAAEAETTVGAYLDLAFGGKAEMGDRRTLGTVELIWSAEHTRFLHNPNSSMQL